MTARFAPGTSVRVREDWPEARGPVHLRTPHYLRGREGSIVRHLGDFPNPEDLAFARPAQRLPLYHVRFAARDIWPGDPSPKLLSPELLSPELLGPELLVEVYEPWLQPT